MRSWRHSSGSPGWNLKPEVGKEKDWSKGIILVLKYPRLACRGSNCRKCSNIDYFEGSLTVMWSYRRYLTSWRYQRSRLGLKAIFCYITTLCNLRRILYLKTRFLEYYSRNFINFLCKIVKNHHIFLFNYYLFLNK